MKKKNKNKKKQNKDMLLHDLHIELNQIVKKQIKTKQERQKYYAAISLFIGYIIQHETVEKCITLQDLPKSYVNNFTKASKRRGKLVEELISMSKSDNVMSNDKKEEEIPQFKNKISENQLKKNKPQIKTKREFLLYNYANILDISAVVKRIKSNAILCKNVLVEDMMSYEDDSSVIDHLWIENTPEMQKLNLKPEDKIQFEATPYIYQRKDGTYDISVENITNIQKIDSYRNPTEFTQLNHAIEQLICETCLFSPYCNQVSCLQSERIKFTQITFCLNAIIEFDTKVEEAVVLIVDKKTNKIIDIAPGIYSPKYEAGFAMLSFRKLNELFGEYTTYDMICKIENKNIRLNINRYGFGYKDKYKTI